MTVMLQAVWQPMGRWSQETVAPGSPSPDLHLPILYSEMNVCSTRSNYRNGAHCKLRSTLGAVNYSLSMRDRFSIGHEDN